MKSTDGGQTFTLLNSATSGLPFVLRGATDVKLDPTDHNTVYASLYGQGVFRSLDGGDELDADLHRRDDRREHRARLDRRRKPPER